MPAPARYTALPIQLRMVIICKMNSPMPIPAPPPNHPATAAPGHAPEQAMAALQSTTLLAGRKAVDIVHNGTVYRLQATRLGKLILTK